MKKKCLCTQFWALVVALTLLVSKPWPAAPLTCKFLSARIVNRKGLGRSGYALILIVLVVCTNQSTSCLTFCMFLSLECSASLRAVLISEWQDAAKDVIGLVGAVVLFLDFRRLACNVSRH